MRLFVAVDLPEEVKGSLDAALEPLRSRLAPARWVRPEGFHLTLAFLGEVAPAFVPAVSKALGDKLAPEGGFRVHFAGLGTFPNAGPVRTLWVGLEPSVRFVRLAELVQDGLRSAGAATDDRPFRSHVTLARCDPPWPTSLRAEALACASGLADDLARTSFACDRVKLLSSTLGKGGATYHAEASFVMHTA
jgi:2'-5' RNA ligase